MRKFWLLGAAGALFLLALSYLLTGVTQVQPGERAVVRRLGRVLDEQPGPGLWFGLPWGIDKVDRVPIERVRRVEVGYNPDEDDTGLTPPGQLLTGDHNLVNMQVIINYKVRDEKVALVQFAMQADRADGVVARTAETALAEWVAGRTVDDVLITAKADLPRWLVAHVQERLDGYLLGVLVQDATVAYALPPDQVKAAFDAVTRAQTGIQTQVNEVEQERFKKTRAAESKRDDLGRQAGAYARKKLLDAREEAKAFEARMQQYHRLRAENPDILAGIWHDEIGKLFAQLKAEGRIDLLDNHLAGDELNITIFPPQPKKQP
jgi:membrane protease subunit HflK